MNEINTNQQPDQPKKAPSPMLSRERIMQATASCLHDEGYDATTIRRIASLLGCAVGSIYRYFRDKRQLLYAVSQQILEPVAVWTETGSPLDRGIMLYHDRATESPQVYRLMFWLASVSPPPTKNSKQDDASEDLSDQSVPRVIERILNGWTAQIGDAEKAKRCWTLLHGSVLLGYDAQQTLAIIRQQLDRPAPVITTSPSQVSPPTSANV